MTDLTKWPRLLVHGNPVTREQANEILVRTNDWWLATNDRDFARQVYDAAGLAYKDAHGYVNVDFDDLKRFRDELGVLNLEYLVNSRVVSSWIGGPHGWCSWEGDISCSTYNIGKWPSVEGVHEEWKLVAAAFPHLDLRAQLVPDEGAAGRPAVEWRVQGGRADMVEPVGLLRTPADPTIDAFGLFSTHSGRERGVTIPRLVEAIEQVRRTVLR